jgi:uncharacterized OsmC-like protein
MLTGFRDSRFLVRSFTRNFLHKALKISVAVTANAPGTRQAFRVRVASEDPSATTRTEHGKEFEQHIMKTTADSPTLNGIDTGLLRDAVEAISKDPAKGRTHWEVTSYWRGGTRSDTHVTRCVIGGEETARDFTLRVDEALPFCGSNQHPNPQEYLLAALNACMIVGYSACCAHEGIELEELRIETEGNIDLRGFLAIDATVKPGYDELHYTVHIKGNGTPEQFERIHRTVMATSPNYFNVSRAIPLKSRLVVGSARLTNATKRSS